MAQEEMENLINKLYDLESDVQQIVLDAIRCRRTVYPEKEPTSYETRSDCPWGLLKYEKLSSYQNG